MILRCLITLSVLVLLSIPCFSQTVVADRFISENRSPGDSLYNHIQQERYIEYFPLLLRMDFCEKYQNLSSDQLHNTLDPLIYNVLDKKNVDFRANRSLALAREKNAGYYWNCSEHSVASLFRFGFKTNALLWAGIQPDLKQTAPVANAALEYRISDHWSVELGGMYSYWHYHAKSEFQGISGYWLEPRYHFFFAGKWPELYLGLYGRVGDYDRRTPNDNYTGDYWDAGVSAGLYLHLIGGWGLEAGARVGYLKTQAMRYVIDGQYSWFEGKLPYGRMRATGLNLSLVYRFNLPWYSKRFNKNNVKT